MYKTLKNVCKIRLQRDVFKFATNGQSDKAFLLTSQFFPQGIVCPCPGAKYTYKSKKNIYKIRLQRSIFSKLARKGQSDKAFLLTSKVCPHGVFCTCPLVIYVYKIIKNMYKIRFQRDFLRLVSNDRSDKIFLLTSKFCPLGFVCSCPGAIYIYEIMKRCV